MAAHNRAATELDHSVLAYLKVMIKLFNITFTSNIFGKRAPKNAILYEREPSCSTLYLDEDEDGLNKS